MASPFKETVTADIAAAIALTQGTWRGQDVSQLGTTAALLPGYSVELISVDLDLNVSTPTESTYRYQFEITHRAAYPASGNLTDAKLVAANAIHDALIGNATLKAPSYGANQEILGATFDEGELSPAGNRAFEVKVTYQIDITGTR